MTTCRVAVWSTVAALAAATFVVVGSRGPGTRSSEPIRVGILHSLSGTMAISETPVVDATRLAIAEINEAGGILGRRLEPVVADGRSDWPEFGRQAERLISEDRVHVIFGCWTSASRKMVKPVVERHDHLLFYPVQYEGLEQSPNIVYTGAAPNQQITPAVAWARRELGARFFLVASDYVFPRAANAIIRDQVAEFGGEIVGERYALLGSQDVDVMIDAIVDARPDVVLNTINGDTNLAFFQSLSEAGLSSADVPVMSFSVAENELKYMDPETVTGHYAAWSYFQSTDTTENERFIERFRSAYGTRRVTDDPMEAAYFGVHLWAKAVARAGTVETAAVRRALAGLSAAAPGGSVSIDSATYHTWKTVRVGRVREDGQFDIVWTSPGPVRPIPFPSSRSPAAWREFLADLQRGWDGAWAAPAP